MTIIEGDVLIPSELIVPTRLSGSYPNISGALFMSGSDLIIVTANGAEVVTLSG